MGGEKDGERSPVSKSVAAIIIERDRDFGKYDIILLESDIGSSVF